MAEILWERAIAFTSTLVAVIAFGLYWGLITKRECEFPSCNQKGDIIKAGIKEDESPCDDFQTYTCGKLYPSQISIFDEIELNLNKFEDKMLTGYRVEGYEPFLTCVHKLYENCVAAINPFLDDVFSRLFRSTYSKTTSFIDKDKYISFSLEEFEYRSRYVGFTAQTLFSFYLDQDRKNPSNNAIYIGLPLSSIFNDNIDSVNITDYKIFIGKVIKNAFSSEQNELIEIGYKMIPYHYNISNMVLRHKLQKVKYLKTTIDKLHNRYSYFDWKQFFLKFLPNESLKKIAIYVKHKSYFDELEHLISYKQLTAFYMMFNNAVEFQLYISDIVPTENSKKLLRASTNRKQYCKNMVKRYFEPGMNSYIIQKFHISDHGQEPLKVIVHHIKQSLKLYLKNAKRIPENIRKKAINKINKLKTILSVSSKDFMELSDEVARTDYYKRACGGKNIIDGITRLNKFLLRHNLHLIDRNITAFDKMDHYQTHKVMYDQIENVVILPTTILQFSAYDSKWPMSLNFGGIGTIISEVLFTGITRAASCDEGDKCGMEWLNSTVASNVSKHSRCHDFMRNHVNDKTANISSLMEHLAGINIAFQAYKNFLSSLWKDDVTVENLNSYSNKQIFFLSYASMFCSDEPIKHISPKNLSTKKTSMNFIHKTIFFKDVFDCDNQGKVDKMINDCLIF